MRGRRRLRKIRPVAVAYVLVLLMMLGVLVDRQFPWEPAVPAAAVGIPAAAPYGAAGEEREIPLSTAESGRGAGPLQQPWPRLLRPDGPMARELLEQTIPLLDLGPRRLVVYGREERPRTLFEALFPFLAADGAREPDAGGLVPSPSPSTSPPSSPPSSPERSPGPAMERSAQPPGQGSNAQPSQPTPGQKTQPPGAAQPGAVPEDEGRISENEALPRGAGCRRPPGMPLVAGGVPLVAIYHTHDYESYISEFPGLHPEDADDWASVWTTNPERNIIRVGRELARALCAQGVTVVHSPTRHAPPMGYFGAYGESRKTAQFILQKYPSIRLLLDLHRDGENVAPDGLTISVQGQSAAPILIVVASGHAEAPQPHWRDNLALAQRLNQALNESYPGLSRGIKQRDGVRYNQDLHPGALLFEMGSVRNRLDEALWSARLLANVLARELRQMEVAPAPPSPGRMETQQDDAF